MDESILNQIKQALGLMPDYTPFDMEIKMHLNAALAHLTQLGVGPEGGFSVTGPEQKWSDLIDDDKTLSNVTSYVYLRVKMLYDPPSTAHLLNSYEELIREEAFRISVAANPAPPRTPLPEVEDDDGTTPLPYTETVDL